MVYVFVLWLVNGWMAAPAPSSSSHPKIYIIQDNLFWVCDMLSKLVANTKQNIFVRRQLKTFVLFIFAFQRKAHIELLSQS